MTNATRKEVLLSLLCCYADLCRMEGQTKDREHDIVASVARAVSRAILDLVEPETEEEPKAEEKSVEEMAENGERLVWSWYDCPSRSTFSKETGRACEKEDCRTCKFRPKDTIPICDWHPKAIKMGKQYFADSPKSDEPPVILYNDANEKHPCPQCGQDCPADLVTGWYFCRTHGLFNTRRRK